MNEYPDFLNVRKLTILVASGPFLVLALLVAIDFSWHQIMGEQSTTAAQCAQVTLNSVAKLDDSACK